MNKRTEQYFKLRYFPQHELDSDSLLAIIVRTRYTALPSMDLKLLVHDNNKE